MTILQVLSNRLLFAGSLGHDMDSQDSSADICNELLIETKLDHAKKLGQNSHVLRQQTSSRGVPAVSQTEENSKKLQQRHVYSQDISQISGPEGKKLTPLSQAGFRDPASIGAGQQLTMFSIEVILA